MRILSKDEMYEADRFAVEKLGFSDEMLMENTGQAVAKNLKDRINKNDKIMVICGSGKNGGDGIVIARQLKSENYDVQLWIVPSEKNLEGTAKKHFDIYKNSGYDYFPFVEEKSLFTLSLFTTSVIIDALLGIGMSGELREPYDKIINWINNRGTTVYSIDVPSGICENRTEVSLAINATATFTVQCPKLSAFSYPSRIYYGEIVIVDIGIPPAAIGEVSKHHYIWTEDDAKKSFPKRKPDSHKGENGRALIIGGSANMPGAVALAARACLRSGTGLLTVALPAGIQKIVSAHMMEAMYIACAERNGCFSGLIEIPDNIDIIAIGMGMGRSGDTDLILMQILELNIPIILDADALYFLPRLWDEILQREAPTIITPHEGEMARLCGVSPDEIRRNRMSYAKEIAQRYKITVILKGPFTVTAFKNGEVYINTSGNAALAKGGSGDVLTGIIAGYWGIHENKKEALCNAVFTHGYSADMLLAEGRATEAVLPTDIIERLGRKMF